MDYYTPRRISYTEIGKIYFWTTAINKWGHLLKKDEFKSIVVESLTFLSEKDLIKVFVIMPNHVHLIWKMNKLNGKERPFGSFLKFTAHEFKKNLSETELAPYKVNASNKKYEFWQRDPMAIELHSSEVAYQKLDYIHQNPVAKDWNLVKEPTDYPYSSASFYEFGHEKFNFLKHVGDEF